MSLRLCDASRSARISTQKDAGRLIGGGPNAFQKYESGDVVVSHAVMSALLLLDRDPSGLAVSGAPERSGVVSN